ncbi:MAG TPA: pyridoxal-phosphate dependent enzyme [Gaiellaceae bacterium]|nr:pyridoxal-phosphate dependent enzyme [Gaiellaceae bacterium]
MNPTPLELAPESLAPGRKLFLKREDVHELGAFKWRGALPTLEEYREGGAKTVVTASTGNHGAATAWAAERLGLRAIVYVPASASREKLAIIERFGADVRATGSDLDQAKLAGTEYAAENHLPFFEDGAEQSQYEGYGAIGAEILEQLEEPPAAVVVPVGNGALLGGIGIELCRRCPQGLRIGVAAKEAPVMAESWEAGGPVESDRSATFADGMAVRVAIPFAVSVLGEVASRMLLVSERAIARAVGAFDRAGIRVEGSPAAALASLGQIEELDGPVVLVVTGRNIDDQLHRRAVDDPDSFPD